MKYFYSDPSVVTSPSKMINMLSNEVKFTMSNDDLSKLKRAASAIGAPDMVLEKNGAGSSLTVKDKKNDTANNYSLDVNTQSDGEFNFFFKVENLKLLDGTYDVEISTRILVIIKTRSSDIEYWIVLNLNQLIQFKLGIILWKIFCGLKIPPNTIRDAFYQMN